MKIDILTLFPEMFVPLKTSILGKAQENNLIDINIINIRDYTKDKHKKCDDTPYGGGAGMVMSCQPIYDAVVSIVGYKEAYKIYMSPRGKVFNQNMAREYNKYNHIIILCGHYEGVDQRVLDLLDFDEISIGDYVLTGGELPAMVLVDAISRFIPGVLHSGDSTVDESFSDNMLEYPQYTKPAEFKGIKVPDVLVSGNHKEIDKWRKKQSNEITKNRRPDLLNWGYKWKIGALQRITTS